MRSHVDEHRTAVLLGSRDESRSLHQFPPAEARVVLPDSGYS